MPDLLLVFLVFVWVGVFLLFVDLFFEKFDAGKTLVQLILKARRFFVVLAIFVLLLEIQLSRRELASFLLNGRCLQPILFCAVFLERQRIAAAAAAFLDQRVGLSKGFLERRDFILLADNVVDGIMTTATVGFCEQRFRPAQQRRRDGRGDLGGATKNPHGYRMNRSSHTG